MTPPDPNAAPSRRLWPAWVRVLLYTLAVLVAAVVSELGVAILGSVAGVLFPALATPPESERLHPVFEVMGSLLSLLSSLAVTWLFMEFVERRPLASLGFERVQGVGLQILAGFGLETTHFTVIYLVGMAAGWYQVVGFAGGVEALGVLTHAFLLFIPAAAFEEITMRGYVLQTLERRHGAVAAVLGNSALFAALHLGNPDGSRPMALLGLLAAGIYLSLCYLATRNLWFPTAVHAAWNIVQGPLFGLPVSGMENAGSILRTRAGGPELWTGGRFGPEAGLVVLITLTLFSLLLWFVLRPWLRPPAEWRDAGDIGASGR